MGPAEILLQILLVLKILFNIADGISDRFGQFVSDLFSSAGSPLGVANAISTWLTSSAGIIVAETSTLWFQAAGAALEKAPRATGFFDVANPPDVGKPWQHVMTPAQACYWVQACFGEFSKFITSTGEQTIVDRILGAIGRWVWRIFTKSGGLRTLLKILKIRSETDLANYFVGKVGKLMDKAQLLAVLAIVAAVFLACVYFAGAIFYISSQFIAPLEWQNHVLNFKNPRERVRTKISRRVGGVAP